MIPTFRARRLGILGLLAAVLLAPVSHLAADILDRTNLVAWCIVPFDSKKRGPEERAQMLERLGIHRLAYDWRSEHVPSFDAEIEALQRHHIELTAWWFPAVLNAESQAILNCLKRHHLSPQLWVSMFPGPETDPVKLDQAMTDSLKILGPICDAAKELGSTVALYNHNGWFGEPVNQVELIRRLKAAGHSNVGIVYNFHHAHDHIADFAQALRLMQPHLVALNLNGMVPNGDKTGKLILPLGTGTAELGMIRTVRASGWKGPIGILGHTDEDAEVKLGKELAGLDRLRPQIDAPARAAGEPAVSGREPGVQGEADWVDNRWQQTELGPFMASAVPLPGKTLAKGLSIRVGDGSLGGMAYDMASGRLHAAWSGDFLKVDSARFGLLRPPQPAGRLEFTDAEGFGAVGSKFRWLGFRVHGNRLRLQTEVDGTSVIEAPWANSVAGGIVFTRDLEIAPHTNLLAFRLPRHVLVGNLQLQSSTHLPERNTLRTISTNGGLVRVSIVRGGGFLVGTNVTASAGNPIVHFIGSDRPVRWRIAEWQGKPDQIAAFEAWESNASLMDQNALAQPGPARWLPELTTHGTRGADTDILAVDTLTLPYDNPWHALMFGSGVDRTPDGAVFLSTIHGDVWRVTGVDSSLGNLHWKRFATGLYQPLGLKVRSGEVFVLGRDRITRLRDENGDGEADAYDSFFDGIQTSTGGHDYVTSLEADNSGRFYFVDPVGVHRVAADGKSQETLATGFRNPNGMGVNADGSIITVAPQQGTWTPSSVIHEIRPGGYYGYGGPRITPERPQGYDPVLCWIPHGVDNSSGGQVWVPRNQWGPLGGHALHLLWGRATMMAVLRDRVDDTAQGAVIPLPVKFLSGPNRGTFDSRDGSLWIAGSTGWQTSALKDGCLQRVRWTGRTAALPVAWHAHENGLTITFSEPVKRDTAEDPGSYSVKQWNYRYAEAYGSKDWSVTNPQKEGRDAVTVKSAHLQPDGRTVFLELDSVKPVMQMEVKWNLDTVSDRTLRSQMWLTVNQPGKAFASGR